MKTFTPLTKEQLLEMNAQAVGEHWDKLYAFYQDQTTLIEAIYREKHFLERQEGQL